MTDRELLELAAKAIGETPVDYECGELLLEGVQEPWNPLQDDAEALRLAVKLGLKLSVASMNSIVCHFSDAWAEALHEPHGDDPYAATRRAIVRAAAEIGRAMP